MVALLQASFAFSCAKCTIKTPNGRLGIGNSVAYSNIDRVMSLQCYQIIYRHLEGAAAMKQTAITILLLNLVYLCRWPYTNTYTIQIDGGI